MKISKTMQDAINAQINAEMYSAYLYLSMSAHFEDEGFPGFANWTRMQYEEEMVHAMKLFDFVNERGGRVVLQAIEQPPVEFGAPAEIFEEILAHEQKVTSLINGLYDVALSEKDYAAQVMLHWFIEEQVEEEDSVSTMIDQFELAGDNKQALWHLDQAAGNRPAETEAE